MSSSAFQRYLVLAVVPVLLSGCLTAGYEKQINETALVISAEKGDTEAVRNLLDEGTDVNTKYLVQLKSAYGQESYTPLASAAWGGHAETVEVLLERGADVSATAGSTGVTPLIGAAMNGHTEVVKMLLAHGADVNAKTVVGSLTALMAAAGNGHAGAVKILLANGADADSKTDKGVSAMVYATGKPEILRLLKQADAR